MTGSDVYMSKEEEGEEGDCNIQNDLKFKIQFWQYKVSLQVCDREWVIATRNALNQVNLF